MRFTEYLRLKESSRKVQPKTKKELIQIIKNTIEKEGYDCDLNFIDTSKITDMAELFYVEVLNKFNVFNHEVHAVIRVDTSRVFFCCVCSDNTRNCT